MYAYDVNGDGLADVITCLNPHGFGLAWYEQLPAKDAAGEIQFKQHLILNPDATTNSYGVAFSQPHSVALADIDGDGLKDIVTGKRFWAHGKHGPDPQSNEPAVLYWFKLVRGPNHSAEFVPHLIDSNSGVGTEVLAGDVNGDGHPDIVVGNKKGDVRLPSAIIDYAKTTRLPNIPPSAVAGSGMILSDTTARAQQDDSKNGGAHLF